MLHERDRTGWSDSSARDVLQLMVESVAELIGFRVAALSVVIGDELVTTAYTGPKELDEDAWASDPVSVLDEILAVAEPWGRLHFIDGERHGGDLSGHWVVSLVEQADGPDAWHPYDGLIGVLRDDDGTPVGVLSVDQPLSGRRPDPTQVRLLERYTAQAERAVLTTLEREALLGRVGHAEHARRLVRSAARGTHGSLDEIVESTHQPLVEGFAASASWIQVRSGSGEGWSGAGIARRRDGQEVPLPASVTGAAGRLAPVLWERQEVLVLDPRGDGDLGIDLPTDLPSELSAELEDAARRGLAWLGPARVIGVPLGAGPTCLGFLVLSRRAQDPPWSVAESTAALELGHDLGSVLTTVRALERERRLVLELHELAEDRARLVATLTHELRTPLTVVAGNLEMLEDLGPAPAAARHHDAMARGTARMQQIVDDMLLLARVSDPHHPLVRLPVVVDRVVAGIEALVRPTAQAAGLDLVVEVQDPTLLVSGDPAEVDRAVGNLVSNAIKYSEPGGTVTVCARRAGDDVLLEVADDGIGISEDDQATLFRAFFRSSNPVALRQPGTGLGLVTVARIAERHGGSVAVRSELGRGTVFTLRLPAAHC
ncbi:Alkaline phosphatase synthesis sensor protein PhoR [Nocardioides dokdonensis FR1436]|uniref:histidine kinase n=1 Tax=Nocardioides dokdonensis FR1436 TaxID=1300347 RepID=A0A1A9GMW2_9ACTN|nr:HAMP domain-containing sensor histidine kinase [Nocardioides dokdonensis]ANH39416.1 Alkaline phosphatase synthesis sensor protein PhoR [Nocardioides dokdonensis FR1436]